MASFAALSSTQLPKQTTRFSFWRWLYLCLNFHGVAIVFCLFRIVHKLTGWILYAFKLGFGFWGCNLDILCCTTLLLIRWFSFLEFLWTMCCRNRQNELCSLLSQWCLANFRWQTKVWLYYLYLLFIWRNGARHGILNFPTGLYPCSWWTTSNVTRTTPILCRTAIWKRWILAQSPLQIRRHVINEQEATLTPSLLITTHYKTEILISPQDLLTTTAIKLLKRFFVTKPIWHDPTQRWCPPLA